MDEISTAAVDECGSTACRGARASRRGLLRGAALVGATTVRLGGRVHRDRRLRRHAAGSLSGGRALAARRCGRALARRAARRPGVLPGRPTIGDPGRLVAGGTPSSACTRRWRRCCRCGLRQARRRPRHRYAGAQPFALLGDGGDRGRRPRFGQADRLAQPAGRRDVQLQRPGAGRRIEHPDLPQGPAAVMGFGSLEGAGLSGGETRTTADPDARSRAQWPGAEDRDAAGFRAAMGPWSTSDLPGAARPQATYPQTDLGKALSSIARTLRAESGSPR